jgi:hypothetical protein
MDFAEVSILECQEAKKTTPGKLVLYSQRPGMGQSSKLKLYKIDKTFLNNN